MSVRISCACRSINPGPAVRLHPYTDAPWFTPRKTPPDTTPPPQAQQTPTSSVASPRLASAHCCIMHRILTACHHHIAHPTQSTHINKPNRKHKARSKQASKQTTPTPTQTQHESVTCHRQPCCTCKHPCRPYCPTQSLY